MTQRAILTWIGASAATALIAAAAWMYLGRAMPDTFSGPPEKLVIAEASQSGFALLYVADAKGYLKESGLDVTFNSFLLGRDALTSVLEGKSDLATVYETPVVMRIYEGKALGVLTTLHTSTRSTKLLARADRGIAQPADLKGKRVGMTQGRTPSIFCRYSLPPRASCRIA